MSQLYNTITINLKQYAVGLFWQLLSKRDDELELRSLAKKLKFDLYAHDRKGRNNQVGFCSTQESAINGVHSLALETIKKINKSRKDALDNFIVALELDADKWYLLAVCNGVIEPDTDCLGGEETIIQRITVLLQNGTIWQAVFGTSALTSLNIAKFEVLHPAKFYKRPSLATSIRPVVKQSLFKRIALNRWFIFGVIFLSIGAMTGYAWYLYLEEQREALRLAELESMQKINPPAPNWYSLPVAKDVIRLCMSGMDVVKSGGWVLESASCDGKNLVTEYSRQAGRLDSFLLNEPSAVVDTGNNKASVKQALRIVLKPNASMIDSYRSATIRLLSNFQQLDIKNTISAPIPVAERVPNQLNRDVVKVDVLVEQTDFEPAMIASFFPPSFRLSELGWKGGAWKLKGTYYAYKE